MFYVRILTSQDCIVAFPAVRPSNRQELILLPQGTRQASLVPQLVKNPPAMQETWVWSLGWEDALEKGKATHSSILA